ncbi:hypothetical protein [Kutzneria chonburiensis]|uniref:DUF1707 domain-containing protein n=1 Tax=Kutzneria chonburiensis TaxID=1483604 RepID=A0ABV6N219_9PSEU|nr:hypothetical protein [Kutzneria chonburiensis]
MTWQEELRALDAELADKGITPAEYRRRRDNLLAAASGGFPPAGQVAPQRPEPPAQPQIPHVQPPPSPIQQPLPPIPTAQQPPSQPIQQQAPTSTPPQPFAASAMQQMPSGPNPIPPAPQYQPVMPTQQPSWSPVTELPMYQPGGEQQAPAPQYAPTPPISDDVFSTRATKKKSRAALLVVVVVVLLLLLAGGWWFGVRPQQPTATSSTTPPTKALHLDDLPQLPGTARLDRAELSVFEAQNRNLFDAREGDFLEADKVTQITFTGSVDGHLNYAVFAFVTGDQAAGAKVSSDLVEYQDLAGLQPGKVDGLPSQVQVRKLVTDKEVQYRAIYASGLNAVMVAVAQTQPVDESAVMAAMKNVATSLLTKAPAS